MALSLRPYSKSKAGFFLIIFLFINSLLLKSYAQRFNNWCFPASTGITFNTTPVTPIISSSAASGRSSASISDFNGNLLFYCDGKAVYNRLHQIMPNGAGLNGGFLNQSSGTMIIPFSHTSNKYFVFNSQGSPFNNTTELGYTYNIVDMSLNGGLGDVIVKNIRLGSHNSSEKMAAAVHSNGADIWLITRDRFNSYYTFKIKCDGVDTTASITTIGYNLNNPNGMNGVMKASPDGKVLAVAFNDSFELFRINQSNGALYDRMPLRIRRAFGVEFSPDSRFLYATSEKLQNVQFAEVLQFDLSVYDSSTIQNSQSILSSITGQNSVANHLQLGPDGKIYKGVFGERWLDVIDKPLLVGSACNYIPMAVSLGNRQGLGTLPFAPPFIFQNPNVQLSYTVASDCRTVTLTGKTYIKGQNLTFQWNFGDGSSQVQTVASGGDTTYASIIHLYPPGTDTFSVSLRVTSDTVCGEGTAGRRIALMRPRPQARFGYATVCNSLSVSLIDSSIAFSGATRAWTFFNKAGVVLGSSAQPNPSFTFPGFDTVRVRLVVTDSAACIPADTAQKMLVLSPKPLVSFVFRQSCTSYKVDFKASSTTTPVRYNWLWGDGTQAQALLSDSLSHLYADSGNYTVQLTALTADGCSSDTAEVSVRVGTFLAPAFTYTPACAGKTVAFISTTPDTAGYAYTWRVNSVTQGSGQDFNQIFPAGSYVIMLEIRNPANGCTATESKTIVAEDLRLRLTASENPTFAGNEFTLRTAANTAYSVLSWQPTAYFLQPSLAVQRLVADTTRLYEVIAQSGGGCRDTASLMVAVTPLDDIYVPSAFTPNGDGKNDILKIVGEGVVQMNFAVYNRWGNIVFQSNNKAGWNGTINGKEAAAGSYVYYLRVKKENGQVVEKKGTVTLIR